MGKKREVKLGVVGVDSGQLMVCDPCYLEDEWGRGNSNRPSNRSIYKDIETGERWTYAPGLKPPEGVKSFPGSYDTPIPECGGLRPNELISSQRWVEEEYHPPSWRGEFSYDGCCELTSHDEGGQLNFKMGHAGAGVVFSSGLGDGVYDVYAIIEDMDVWGERVVSVRIDLVGER